MKNRLLLLFISICCSNCHQDNTIVKHQNKRDHIIDVSDKVVEFEPDSSVLFGSNCGVSLFDQYLFITDPKSPDNQIHIFNKKTFEHLASTAPVGQGPDEITGIGDIVFLESQRKFYVTDFGKLCIYSYSLDSLLADPEYRPYVRLNIKEQIQPSSYQLLNDSLAIARIIYPTGISGFTLRTGLWNMNTMEYEPFEDLHPELEKKRYAIGVFKEQNMVVECHFRYNVMSVRNIDGSLRYDILGKTQPINKKNWVEYYQGPPLLCKDKIVVAYLEKPIFSIRQGIRKTTVPTQLLVFNLQGDYVKTLETKHNVWFPTYDKETNRIYFFQYESDSQFAYLDLDGLLD